MNIKDRIFIATFANECVEVAREYEFSLEINDTCISNNLNKDNLEQTRAWIKKEIEGANLTGQRVFLHGPFTELTPDAMDDRVIELMWTRYMETIELCKEFGIHDIVLHDGYIPLMYHKVWHVQQSIPFWQRVSDSLPEGFTVYVENVFDDEPNLLLEVIQGVDCSNIKACLDIGHANALTLKEYSVEKWVEILGPVIGHFHIHNNDGKDDLHNDIQDGTMDIEKVFAAAERFCSSDVTFTIESREARPSAEFLKKIYG